MMTEITAATTTFKLTAEGGEEVLLLKALEQSLPPSSNPSTPKPVRFVHRLRHKTEQAMASLEIVVSNHHYDLLRYGPLRP